eukprot:2284146-Rhodomonas_salina.1
MILANPSLATGNPPRLSLLQTSTFPTSLLFFQVPFLASLNPGQSSFSSCPSLSSPSDPQLPCRGTPPAPQHPGLPDFPSPASDGPPRHLPLYVTFPLRLRLHPALRP